MKKKNKAKKVKLLKVEKVDHDKWKTYLLQIVRIK